MKTQVRENAEKDPAYCPYCLRCPGLVRMRKVSAFYWRCSCGAEHDERITPTLSGPLDDPTVHDPDNVLGLRTDTTAGEPGGPAGGR
jgi:hypothetical protein